MYICVCVCVCVCVCCVCVCVCVRVCVCLISAKVSSIMTMVSNFLYGQILSKQESECLII